MILFIKKMFKPIGFVFLSMTMVFANVQQPFLRKPFNYRAFEARKRGEPIVIYRTPKEMVPQDYLKIVPTWPAHLRFPNPDNQGIAFSQLGCNWANWSYNDDRELGDPSQVFLGNQNPTLADVSLIARLHKNSLADMGNNINDDQYAWILRTTETPSAADPEAKELGAPNPTGTTLANIFRANNRYLAFLADRVFDFKSYMREPFFTFSYQASFYGGTVSVGLEVPIIYRIQRMDMVQRLSTEDNQILSRTANFPTTNALLQDFFFSAYPTGFNAFWDDILKQKDFTTDPRATRFGIGDITFFVTRKFEGNYWNLGLVGLGLTVPSASMGSKKFVWPIELGNGGFWEARPYLAMHWQQSRLVNPHIFSELRFVFSNQVDRRVSQLVTFDGISTANVLAKDLPLGTNLVYANKNIETNVTPPAPSTLPVRPNRAFINEPESSISALAAGPLQTVEIAKGSSVVFRIGNLFDQCFFDRAYLDVYYQFTYKFTDRLATRVNENLFDMSALVKKTERWEQQIAAAFSYRWTDSWQFEAKGTYIFSGKNVLRNCGLSVGMQVRL